MRLFIFLALLGGCLAEKKNLPSRGDISIYLIEDGESSGTEIYLAQKSPDGNPTRVVLRSDNQHVADEPLITLEAGGRTLPVFKEKDGEDSIYVVYTIKKGPSRVDLISAILEAFGAKSKSFMDIVIDGENQQWLDVALEALIKLKVKAETAKISTFKRKVVVTEAAIHKLIKSAQLQKLNIGEVQIPELSSGFFLSPRVRDLVSIDVAGAEKNDIDDKALGALKATRLRLGSAPLLTLQGLRHFVQPAFEQGIREIGIQNPNFVVEPNILFKGLKVKHEQKKESPPFTTQTWDLEGKYGKFVFETKTNANGYVAYQAGPR